MIKDLKNLKILKYVSFLEEILFFKCTTGKRGLAKVFF
jgi:hypothetical protein